MLTRLTERYQISISNHNVQPIGSLTLTPNQSIRAHITPR